MYSRCLQLSGGWVDGARDRVGGEDVRGIGIGVAEEVGEGYGWEGIVVGIGGFVEFHHCGRWGRFMLLCFDG